MKFDIGGVAYELYRHPLLYITDEVSAWWQEYKWVEKAGAGMDYWVTNPKYHTAAGVYGDYLSKFRSVKNV